MTPDKGGELFAKIEMLINMVGGLGERVGKLEVGQGEIKGELRGLSKRMDDQAAILAALIPQKLAAIAGRPPRFLPL